MTPWTPLQRAIESSVISASPAPVSRGFSPRPRRGRLVGLEPQAFSYRLPRASARITCAVQSSGPPLCPVPVPAPRHGRREGVWSQMDRRRGAEVRGCGERLAPAGLSSRGAHPLFADASSAPGAPSVERVERSCKSPTGEPAVPHGAASREWPSDMQPDAAPEVSGEDTCPAPWDSARGGDTG